MAYLFFFRLFFSRQAGSVVRSIALLSWTGIALGMFAMIVVMSVMTGFGDGIRRRILNVDAHIYLPEIQRLSDVTDRWGQHPGVDSIEPYENQDVFVRTVDELSSGASARGLSSRELLRVGETLLAGRKLSEIERAEELEPFRNLGEDQILMGADLARSIGVFEGEEITLVAPEALLLPPGEVPPFQKVIVRSLIRTNVADFDSQTIFYNIDAGGLRKLGRTASLLPGVMIRLKDPSVQPEIEAGLKDVGVLYQTWEQRNAALFYSLRLEKFLMGVFLALTLLVASFAIVVVLFLLSHQKRQDIGILLAMGYTKRQIQKLFTILGMGLASMGILLGSISGIVLCLVWERYPIIQLPDIYYDTRIPVRLDWPLVLMVVGIGFAVAFFASFWPARQLTTLQPVEALRAAD